MFRAALTLWFTFATLAGPGVCCCSFASTDLPAKVGQSLPASKPAKSCCQTDPQPCGEQRKQDSDPSKPSKCPCEHGKQATSSLPASESGGSDLVAQLRLNDALLVGFTAPSAFDSPTVTLTRADTSTPVSRLAGRDLLAAYSTLRC